MTDNFKFKLCSETYPEHDQIVFNAKSINGGYNVTWEDDEQGIDYTKEETKKFIDEGVWLVV